MPVAELGRVWALDDQARKARRDAPLPREILAISDPSDALTFRMPPIAGVKVSNVYVRFVSGAPGVVADPIKAHSGPPKDPRFWKILLEGAGTKRR